MTRVQPGRLESLELNLQVQGPSQAAHGPWFQREDFATHYFQLFLFSTIIYVPKNKSVCGLIRFVKSVPPWHHHHKTQHLPVTPKRFLVPLSTLSLGNPPAFCRYRLACIFQICTEGESHSVPSCACLASSLQHILETSVVLRESVVHLLVLLADRGGFEMTGNAITAPRTDLLRKFRCALEIVPRVFRSL